MCVCVDVRVTEREREKHRKTSLSPLTCVRVCVNIPTAGQSASLEEEEENLEDLSRTHAYLINGDLRREERIRKNADFDERKKTFQQSS